MLQISQSTVLFLILLSNGFLSFGGYYMYDSILSFQSFLIGQRCNASASSAPQLSLNCCHECLGLNPLEYNILVGLPLATSVLAGCAAGYIIDKYGFRLFTAISTFLPLVGGAMRAAGTDPSLPHLVSYLLLLFGGLIVDNAFTIFYVIQLYVCTRWFSGRYLSFSIGMCLSVSLTGSVLAYYMNVPLAKAIGLQNTFWVAIPIAASAVAFGLVLVWVDVAGEKMGCEMVTQRIPPDFSVASLKAFEARFWLLSVIVGFSWLLFYAFIGNAVAMQNDIFGISPENAAFASGMMYIVKIGVSPIAGAVGERYDVHGAVAMFGCACSVAGTTLLSLGVGPALVIIVLMGLGFAASYVAMASVLPDLVPFEKLATANGIMNAFLCLDIGAADILVGVITNAAPTRREGWLASAAFLLSVAIVQTLVTSSMIFVDSRAEKRVLFRGRGRRAGEEFELRDSEKVRLLGRTR